jgi:hypothetical protein
MVNKMCRIDKENDSGCKCECTCIPEHINTFEMFREKSEHWICYACKLCFHASIIHMVSDGLDDEYFGE